LLDRIKSHYFAISAGEKNRSGHPHEETLERFDDVGAAVLRTDENGTIKLITGGEQLRWVSNQ